MKCFYLKFRVIYVFARINSFMTSLCVVKRQTLSLFNLKYGKRLSQASLGKTNMHAVFLCIILFVVPRYKV